MASYKFISSVCAASALAFAAVSAQASTVTLKNVTAEWLNVGSESSATKPVITGNNTADPQLRWGQTASANDPRSGYNFSANASIYGDAQDENDPFALGTFEHLNNVIYVSNPNSSITGVDLKITFSFVTDETGGDLDDPNNWITRSSTFTFAHLETPNGASVCAGGPHDPALDVNGCADRVTAVTNTGSSDTFTIGNTTYFLDVTGFDMGDEFWTIENQTNTTTLYAQFQTVTTPSPVPLPAGGLLLLGGLGALGVMRRRRKAA